MNTPHLSTFTPQSSATHPFSLLHPPSGPLLFWQLGLLCVVAGIMASRFPLAATAAWLVGAWALERATGARLFTLALCFVLGIGLGWFNLPKPVTPPPEWLTSTPLRIQGTVHSLRGLSDNRIRITLTQVRPAGPTSQSADPASSPTPLPEHVMWTWEAPTLRPLPGQQLSATLSLRPLRGFVNENTPDMSTTWRQQGTGYTAWARGHRAEVELHGTGSRSARLREQVRGLLMTALYGAPNAFPLAAPPAPRAGLHAATQPPVRTWTDFFRTIYAPVPLAELPMAAPGVALLAALLFGDQTGMDAITMERVTRSGLRHSLALSGQHLAVVGVLALGPVLMVGWLWPLAFVRWPRRLMLGLCSLPPAVLCLWLGDAPPSLIRAALMLLLWVMATWQGRPMTLLDVLCGALACMVVADPACVLAPGVQLSVLAVAGIAVCLPWMHRLMPTRPLPPQSSRRARAAHVLHAGIRATGWTAALSVAAQAATLPVALQTFGRVYPWGLLNVLWLPALSLVVLPLAWLGLGLLCMGWHGPAHMMLALATLPCTCLLEGLAWLDQTGLLRDMLSLRPHWTSMLGYGALLVSLLMLLEAGRTRTAGTGITARRLAVAGAVLLLCSAGLRAWETYRPGIRLRLLDVGQGQAVLLEWPGGRGIIDSGGFASRRFDSGRDLLAPLLTANRAPTLTFAALSHLDRDHAGGMPWLLDKMDVGTFCLGPVPPAGADVGGNANSAIHAAILTSLFRHDREALTLTQGQRLQLGADLWLEAVWPPPGHLLRGNDSLVLRLVHRGEGLALLTGDLPTAQQQALLHELHTGTLAPDALRSHAVLVPHHGSVRNLLPEFYDAVQARVALGSSGANNQWDFPSPQVRAALQQRGIALYSTAEYGGMTVRFDPKPMTLRVLLPVPRTVWLPGSAKH